MKKYFPYFTALLFLVLACKEKQEIPKPNDESALFKSYVEELSGKEVFQNEGMVILLSKYSCNSCNTIILKHLNQKASNKNIKLIFTGFNPAELAHLANESDLNTSGYYIDSLDLASQKGFLVENSMFFVKRKDGSEYLESINPNLNLSEVLEWIDTLSSR
ncbi:MAG: hypothetical protein U1C58_03090 [Flavobacteriaceae bacterium]|nr:hypothetical protein [Flavobacteriaceae bacterium]